MTTPTANSPLVFQETPRTDWYDHPVKISTHLYVGQATTKDATTGGAHDLTAGEDLLGFVEHEADNSGSGSAFSGATIGTGAEGNITANIRTEGQVQLTVTIDGSTLKGDATDRDVAVYGTDGATFTYSSGGSAVKIGTIVDFVSKPSTTTAIYIVGFQSTQKRNQ